MSRRNRKVKGRGVGGEIGCRGGRGKEEEEGQKEK